MWLMPVQCIQYWKNIATHKKEIYPSDIQRYTKYSQETNDFKCDKCMFHTRLGKTHCFAQWPTQHTGLWSMQFQDK